MRSGIVAIVSLYIHAGREEQFRRFETAAARIMRRYGGRIERVFAPHPPSSRESGAHEIHIVTFPELAQLEAYRRDAELAELAPLRQEAIARTEIVYCDEAEPYLADERD